MFIIVSLFFFTIKLLALSVVGLFFIEDLDLIKDVNQGIFAIYAFLGICTFVSLFFFTLFKKLLWLIIGIIAFIPYGIMYNSAPEISDIHEENNLHNRYFKDSQTFILRMTDVAKIISKIN